MDSEIGWYSSTSAMTPAIAGATSEGTVRTIVGVYTLHDKWDEGKN